MALVVYTGDKMFELQSPITDKTYKIVPNAEINMEDIDAVYYFGYDLRDQLTDVEIERIILPRLDWQLSLEEWKKHIAFEPVGKMRTKLKP